MNRCIRNRDSGHRDFNHGGSSRTARGFSLLEVLIAVVVLSVGLLALAALQGSLTRASADAKVRARVAAMLTARMDGLRLRGYVALANDSVSSTQDDACDPGSLDGQVHCTREQAALDSLVVNQVVQTYSGATDFTETAPTAPNAAQFRRVTLTATWSDATGANRLLGMASDISALALTNILVPPPDDLTTGAGGPVVRTINPATAGVIPIALGLDSTSATSNPVPELVGKKDKQQVVGTKFTVLNYTPPGAAGDVVVQKRFENEVIKCRCQYGAGGVNLPEIYRDARWPAIWTGQRYNLHDPGATAPGQTLAAGPAPDVLQSPLCQECCRDHHDSGDADVVRFDPERGDGAVTKYDADGTGLLTPVANTTSATYVDACRVIRVDGFWRTASDMYARQYGLLETQAVAGVAAKSGLPTDGAVDLYTDFVKDFLASYDGDSGAPTTDGQATFDATAGIDAATIVIDPASTTDHRYLHGRALYVDYLEEEARTKLADVLDDTGDGGLCPSGTPAEDCVMPFLPFTAANLTEIARWAQVGTPVILNINSGNLLETDPALPSGGRTTGIAEGTAENRSSIRRSNSGIAVSDVLAAVAGIDPEDNDASPGAVPLDDTQPFEVIGPPVGPAFDVAHAGGGANPFVYFTLGTDVDRECFKPADANHHCVTAPGTTLPLAGAVRIAGYWMKDLTSQSLTVDCGGTMATATVLVPTFHDFEVTAATSDGAAGTIDLPVGTFMDESTTVHFAAIAANGLVEITLAEQVGSPVLATIASCTTNAGGTEINVIAWNESWANPAP